LNGAIQLNGGISYGSPQSQQDLCHQHGYSLFHQICMLISLCIEPFFPPTPVNPYLADGGITFSTTDYVF
jgi:predicted acylesterase/phospholipase RssA